MNKAENKAFTKATREAKPGMKTKTQGNCEIEFMSDHPNGKNVLKTKAAYLRQLRQMETQAEKDIRTATKAGDVKWKKERTQALNAIRAQIREVKGY